MQPSIERDAVDSAMYSLFNTDREQLAHFFALRNLGKPPHESYVNEKFQLLKRAPADFYQALDDGSRELFVRLAVGIHSTLADNPEWFCPACGSAEIQLEDWVEVNTGRVIGDGASQDYWCSDCCRAGRESHFKYPAGREDV